MNFTGVMMAWSEFECKIKFTDIKTKTVCHVLVTLVGSIVYVGTGQL